jgi:ketosteroid isomerase-like protein
MSRENLELVRRTNDAYNRRDLDAFVQTLSESVRFEPRFSAMDRRIYLGHDGVRRYFAELDEVWSRYEMKLERLVAVGSRVAGLFHLYAVGRESGLHLEERPGVVFTLQAGTVVLIDAYLTQADALEAVGLSE